MKVSPACDECYAERDSKRYGHAVWGKDAPRRQLSDYIPCTVLDPFAGAFTSAVVARELGRSFVGIELNPEYIALRQKRLDDLGYSGKLPPQAEPEAMEVAG